MKKAVLLALVLSAAASPAFAALKVVTSLQDFASIADSIGGKRVETFAIARGYQDPHFVDPKPSFVLKLSRADLLIAAGLELEIGYLPPLIDQSRNEKIHPGSRGYLDASIGCDILNRPTGVVTRAMGDVHPFGNPHYWTDPENGRVIARAVAAKLSELDPAGRADYQKNLAAFEAKLTAKDKEWKEKMSPYAGVKVVTFHDSWPNFAKHFDLDVVNYIEPRPGIPPTPSHTLEVVNLMKRESVKIELIEPYFDLKTPNSIASMTNGKVVVMMPSVGGKPEITDYFKLFDYDINVLKQAFEQVK